MPKDEKEAVEKVIDKVEAVEEKTPKPESKVTGSKWLNSNTTILIVSVLVSLLLAGSIVAVVGSIVAGDRSNFDQQPNDVTIYGYRSQPRMHRVFVQTNTVTSESNTTMVSGVVKSVGNNSFVIAGNGTQTTIDTNGDTTYNTADRKITANDSVVVIGTKANDTVTATDIQIVNF